MREFLVLFGLQFVSYFNITLDMRAVAHGQYLVAAVTNVMAPVIAWLMIRRVSSSVSQVSGMVAVALGGLTSALLGMWLTRAWG